MDGPSWQAIGVIVRAAGLGAWAIADSEACAEIVFGTAAAGIAKDHRGGDVAVDPNEIVAPKQRLRSGP